ncbi:MFS transporter [Euzebya tangerina]|uniref:MFS transporter n=1 Tax=Euzebya tangerina TaxID=591198 RepID=UPI000E31EB37|nr:MFS transporter [Euzebya tangerina]
MTADTAAGGIFSPALRRQSVALLTTVGLSSFEALAASAALPAIAADLGDVALLPWVITAYLLTSGVATVAAGALVDRHGIGPVFRWSIVTFVVGATLAGLAPSMAGVIAARVLQGVGSGAVTAVSLAAVTIVFPARLVSRAFAANSTVWGVMGVAGPALAAGLLAVASWRWVFLVAIPLGASALALGWRSLPATPPTSARGTGARLNPTVLGLLTVVSASLLYAVDALDWTSAPAAVVCVGAGWLVLRLQRGRSDALVAPRHAIDSPLGPLAFTPSLILVGGIGLSAFMPLYLAAGRGIAQASAAWSVVFFTVGWTLGANVASRLVERWTPLVVTRGGVLLMPLALSAFAAGVLLDGPLWVLFALAVLGGSSAGTTTNSALTILGRLAPTDELGRATAAHQFVRNTGFAVGNAMVGAVILFVVATGSGDVGLVQEVLASAGEGAEGAMDEVADAIRRGYGVAVAIGAAISALALVPLRRVGRALQTIDGQDGQMNTQRS